MFFEKHTTEKENWEHEKENMNSFSYFETPVLPNVFVRDISGRMQERPFLCGGSRIQSSQ